jgi:dual specificity protein kinase YAK1
MSGRPTSLLPGHARDSSMSVSDRDGDISMEDADYRQSKHSSQHIPQVSHQRVPSMIQQEESAAARRYSPMNLSPSSPYATASHQPSQSPYTSYTPQTSSRTSPTRSSYIQPPNNYYASPPGKYIQITLESY